MPRNWAPLCATYQIRDLGLCAFAFTFEDIFAVDEHKVSDFCVR
jgi:hypothetical protein